MSFNNIFILVDCIDGHSAAIFLLEAAAGRCILSTVARIGIPPL